MLQHLPIELVLETFREAAEIFVVSDRGSAVSLAQTSRLVYNTVRRILLRRVVVTAKNCNAIGDLLQQADGAALILDLHVTAVYWDPSGLSFCNLTNIRSIRGIDRIIYIILAELPASARTSLFKIQLWAPNLEPVPPSVTHVCLSLAAANGISLQQLLNSVKDTPFLTNFGFEFINTKADRDIDVVWPDTLVKYLRAIFDVGGPQLRQIAVRLCGRIVVAEGQWDSYLAVLRKASEGEEWATG